MWMVDLLDKLFWSQNIYLTDRYCFQKVVPKVVKPVVKEWGAPSDQIKSTVNLSWKYLCIMASFPCGRASQS